MKELNKKLHKLYNKYWGDLIQNCGDILASSPLLIKVPDGYEKANIKIMICGQETYGWNGALGEKNIDFLMNDYQAYLCNNQDYFRAPDYKDDFYSNDGTRLNRKNKRSFWNKSNFSYLEKELTNHFTSKDKSVSFIWNNLSKIGNSRDHNNGKGRATKIVRELEQGFFNVFEEELRILQPNIIIFRTGNRCIANSESTKLTKENPVNIVNLTNFPDIFAVKSYHPARSKKEFKEIICNKIKNNKIF